MSWSTCPVCAVVVADAQLHADWHGLTVAADESLTGQPAPSTTGDGWPVGLPVPVPLTLDPGRLAELAQIGRATIGTINTDALPALDAYLALGSPTTAQTVAQVRILTRIVRGMAVAVRAIIRITIRSLTED